MSDEAVLSQSQHGPKQLNCFWNCSDSGAPENVSEEAECFNNSGPKMFYPTKRNFQLLRSPTFIR